MLFNSFDFLLFFPIVAVLFFYTRQQFRWVLLLFASYYFYMSWEPAYAILIITSTCIDYWASHRIQKSKTRVRRNLWLVLSLVTNFGLLFSFKYYSFFSESLGWISVLLPIQIALPKVDWLLPVGISFYTFQTVSYTIDVYRGKQRAEEHFGYFALYVSFFPQLVAGPIERPGNLLPQFRETSSFEYGRVTNALKLMAWGMFKKTVIADQLSLFVDPVYNSPADYSGPFLVIATVCFAIQIYCDFSGYSDIAIGAAMVLGINLARNFDSPYLANSIGNFWQRWHISLSTWFRDYVYFPLGGNRVSVRRWHLNILVVFLTSGLWHGANWTFVMWGAIHGLFYVIHNLTESVRARFVGLTRLDRVPAVHRGLQVTLTLIPVCFAWIFFRANSIGDAVFIVSHLSDGWSILLDRKLVGDTLYGILGHAEYGHAYLAVVWPAAIASMMVFEHRQNPRELFAGWPWWIRWPSYYALLIAMLLLSPTEQAAFIYFQF